MIPSNVSLRTTLDAVQKKIDGKDFAGALTVLNKLAKDESRRASLVDTSRMYFTMAWCLYELGHYKHSLLRVRAALKLARPTAAHDLYAREKQLCGIVLTRIGRNLDATEAYLEAFAGFKRSGQNQMLYGTLVNLGLCHFAQGDLGQSERNFTDAESYARKYNSPHEIGLCRRNIARVLVFSGLFDRASLILGSPMLSETSMIAAAQVSTILSQIDVFRLEFDRGSVSLQKSKMIFGTASSARDVAVCLEFLGLNEYFAGNYAKAREYYDQVLAMPEPTASAVAQTLRMLTDVEIAEGNWDAAKATAARADAAINKISERIELGALWRAYGQFHTHDNDHAKAREYFAAHKPLGSLHGEAVLRREGPYLEIYREIAQEFEIPLVESREAIARINNFVSEPAIDAFLDQAEENEWKLIDDSEYIPRQDGRVTGMENFFRGRFMDECHLDPVGHILIGKALARVIGEKM